MPMTFLSRLPTPTKKVTLMDQPRYVDPNSGAAPQPGGAAGFLAQQRGHSVVVETEEDSSKEQIVSPDGLGVYPNEPVAPSYEEFNEEDVREFTESERVDLKEREVQARGAAVGEGDETEEREEEDAEAPEPGVGADGVKRTEDERAELKAVETGSAVVTPSTEDAGDEDEADDDGDDDGTYDPSEHTVDEVNAYLEENPDQRDAVVAAERKGKDRKGVTGDE
jgi:hypothetical protein